MALGNAQVDGAFWADLKGISIKGTALGEPQLILIGTVAISHVDIFIGPLKAQIFVSEFDEDIIGALNRDKIKVLCVVGACVDEKLVVLLAAIVTASHAPLAFASFFLPVVSPLPVQLETEIG